MTATIETGLADIEALAESTLDERGRQRFCSALRRYAIQDMPAMVEADFHDRVRPREATPPGDARAIAAAMRGRASYRFYSSIRYNAQEMCFQSVQDSVERALPAMIAVARDAAAGNPAGGTLRLADDFAMPAYATALDTHLTPGSFHSEWVAGDVAQGAVVSLGSRVFTATMNHRGWGGVARAIGRWIRATRPDFRPRRILDLGTSAGKNLMPYRDFFPDAELYGIDIAAPLLRWGHAVAGHERVPIHFSRQNAEATDFPDGAFDLIVSSFFFHEIPVKATARVLDECRRLLAPGGLMVHQELPATGLVDAYEDYFWNWDTANNNEPFYTAFRAEDPIALMAAAGFAPERSFACLLPDVGAFPDRTAAFGWDEPGRPRHGKGAWYVFGSES